MRKQTSLLNIFVGLRGVVARFRNPETHTNAPQRHNTLQTMAIEVREVTSGSWSTNGPGGSRMFASSAVHISESWSGSGRRASLSL